LKFRAQIKGLRYREAKWAVEEAMDICSLTEVNKKIISTLSKGYKQRVGLADALVNKPELLILDEPTNGLDPNQIRQSRELIKRLGERHTILISTHILSEVEMTCNRVIILDRGKIKASDTPQNLIRRLRQPGAVLLEIKGKTDQAVKKVQSIEGVKEVTKNEQRNGWLSLSIVTDPNIDIREEIFDLTLKEKWKVRELASRTASLEDAFVDLVQSGAVATASETGTSEKEAADA